MLNKGDLPQPDGPMMLMNSPLAAFRLMSSSTWTGPVSVPKRLERLRISSFKAGAGLMAVWGSGRPRPRHDPVPAPPHLREAPQALR
ncbi:hypothetical protein G6F57_022203 [Rhizopus arrhizus]|nr:hypothetical protein G6F57_022203 [Rhizopus arrhizus]